MRITLFHILSLVLFSVVTDQHLKAYGPSAPVWSEAHVDTLPQVFMIGQNEDKYENLVSTCSKPLLNVCDDSMDTAYRRWMLMLSDIEKYADKSEFDIKGIKIWLNVFWNSDGSIRHLVYFPKPNSRNMDFDDLTIFLGNFAKGYQMEIPASNCFSHYGSAAFPSFAEYYLNEEK